MEIQRDKYIQVGEFERSQKCQSQRNEKALVASMLEMYVSGVSILKVSKIVEELCEKICIETFYF